MAPWRTSGRGGQTAPAACLSRPCARYLSLDGAHRHAIPFPQPGGPFVGQGRRSGTLAGDAVPMPWSWQEDTAERQRRQGEGDMVPNQGSQTQDPHPQWSNGWGPADPAPAGMRAAQGVAQVVVTAVLVAVAFAAGWFGNGFI